MFDVPAPTRPQAITDAVVGGAVGVLGCLVVWALSETRWWYPSDWTLQGYLWAVAALGVVLALRRAAPGVAALLAFGPYAYLLPDFRPTLVHHLPIALAAYAVVRTGALRWYVALGGAACATLLLFTYSLSFMPDPSELAQLLAVTCFAVALGQTMCRLEVTRSQLEQRNAELVALQGAEAERAVTAERNRISRDLHDIVAHHVTAIVVRAQAALHVSRSRPEKAPEALEWIVTEGKESLAAMRSMVSVLRADQEATEDLATSLDRVAQRLRSGGLAIRLDVPRPSPEATPAVRQAALRITQEALTNVALHSGAREASVEVARADGALRLTITDPGPRLPGERRDGNGLRHMQERADGVRARLSCGPHGAGWRVLADFPAEFPERTAP